LRLRWDADERVRLPFLEQRDRFGAGTSHQLDVALNIEADLPEDDSDKLGAALVRSARRVIIPSAPS
jgi:hypothetical protein